MDHISEQCAEFVLEENRFHGGSFCIGFQVRRDEPFMIMEGTEQMVSVDGAGYGLEILALYDDHNRIPPPNYAGLMVAHKLQLPRTAIKKVYHWADSSALVIELNSAPACYEVRGVRLGSRPPESSTWELIWNIADDYWTPVRNLWYLEDHLWTSGHDFAQPKWPGQLAICLVLPANSKLPKLSWRWSVYEACQGSLVLKDYAEEQKVLVQDMKKEKPREMEVYQGKFKTELCDKWETPSGCPYADSCKFAHGIEELRPVHRHNLRKTRVCTLFSRGLHCIYGDRCAFRHDLTGEEKFK